MGNHGNAKEAEVKQAIANVCQRHGQIRQILRSGCSTQDAPLNHLLAVLATDDPVDALVDALHFAVIEAGDAIGVYGDIRSGASLLGLPPASDPKAIYLCPHRRRCTRFHWVEDEPSGPPECELGGIAMLKRP